MSSASHVTHARPWARAAASDALATWFGLVTGVGFAWPFHAAHALSHVPADAHSWATEPLFMAGHVAVVLGLAWLARSPRAGAFRGGLLFGAAIADVAWFAIWFLSPALGG